MYLLRLSDVAKYVIQRLEKASPLVVYFNVGRVSAVREGTSYWKKLGNKDLKLIGKYDNGVSEEALLEDLICYFEGLSEGLEWLWTTDLPPTRALKRIPHCDRWCV